MKIKDIEQLTGMTRDNIRFYERQELLKPIRDDKGFREYDENDVQTLKRIKLLRCLHISIEDIKQLQNNEINLNQYLNSHLNILEKEKNELETSTLICKQMISKQISYHEIEADTYLAMFDNNVIKQDVLPKLKQPIRRFLARLFDNSLYLLIWNIIFVLIFNVDINQPNLSLDLLSELLVCLTILFIEPILLSKFGSTLGKWILGLSIQDDEGNHLTYAQAFERTKHLIKDGYGFFIPIYTLFKLYYNYRQCNDGQTLKWEENSEQIYNEKTSSYVLYPILILLLIYFDGVNNRIASLPSCVGELTVDDLAKNMIHNQVYDYIEWDERIYPNEEGYWELKNEVIDSVDYPKLDFVFEDEKIVEISFESQLNDLDDTPPTYQNLMKMLIHSYFKAQDSYNPFISSVETMISKIENHPYESFEFHYDGMMIKCDIKYHGFSIHDFDGHPFIMIDSLQNSYSLKFVIKQEK